MSKKIEIVTVKRVQGNIEYSRDDIDSYFGKNGSGQSDGAVRGERALSHSFLMDTLRKVMGRTLTVIDASVHEKTQNKAMKDLIKGIFSDEIEFSSEMAFDQEIMTKRADESFSALSEEEQKEVLNSEASIEEVLGVKV